MVSINLHQTRKESEDQDDLPSNADPLSPEIGLRMQQQKTNFWLGCKQRRTK
jgi:hypothetical protein